MHRSWFPVIALTLLSIGCGYWFADIAIGWRASSVEEPVAIAEVPLLEGATPRLPLPAPKVLPPTVERPRAELATPTAPVQVTRSPAVSAGYPRQLRLEPLEDPSPDEEVEPEPEEVDFALTPLATSVAMDEVDMRTMDPFDEDYDEVIEALQRFHEFEKDIRSYDELTQEAWDEIQTRHLPETEALVERAAQLNTDGHPAEAESLMLEWDLLEAKYAKRVK